MLMFNLFHQGRCRMKRLSVFLLMYLGCQGSANALELFDDFQIHGFISQGYFLTSANRVFGSSDRGGSLDFTEAGLNGSWRPHPDWQIASQVLFRRAGAGHDKEVSLDFGLIDYTPFSSVDYRIGLRLGRFKNPIGFYNETRDVAFTRPSILLPQSIYPDYTRNLSLSGDGGLIYGEYRSPWGSLLLEFGLGFPRSDNTETKIALLGLGNQGKTTSELSYIGRLSYELDEGRLRLAITGAHARTGYRPQSNSPGEFGSGADVFEPVIFSAQYNAERWSLTSEYALRSIQDKGFGVIDGITNGESYYFQGVYRIDSQWEVIGRYDVLYADTSDRDGQKHHEASMASKLAFTTPAHSLFAKDLTFGVRYNVNSSFMLAAEYHNVNGTGWLSLQDNPDVSKLKQHWDMFSLLASFRF